MDLLPEIITVGIAKTGRLYWFGGLFKTPEMYCTKDMITVERQYSLVNPPVNYDTSDMVLDALKDAAAHIKGAIGIMSGSDTEEIYNNCISAIKKSEDEP